MLFDCAALEVGCWIANMPAIKLIDSTHIIELSENENACAIHVQSSLYNCIWLKFGF